MVIVAERVAACGQMSAWKQMQLAAEICVYNTVQGVSAGAILAEVRCQQRYGVVSCGVHLLELRKSSSFA